MYGRVRRSEGLKRMVLEEFGMEAGDEDGYVERIGGSRRMYSSEMTNRLAVWDLMVGKICG
jgi:hypothetical protein